MQFKLDFDEKKFIQDIEEKVTIPDDVRNRIVLEVADEINDKYLKKIPIDTGSTQTYFRPSQLRIYDNATFVSVGFDPKKFGKVKAGKKWITDKNDGSWGYFYISSFYTGHPNFGLFRKWQKSAQKDADKLLKQKLNDYLNSK